jgi:hypothetical protein
MKPEGCNCALTLSSLSHRLRPSSRRSHCVLLSYSSGSRCHGSGRLSSCWGGTQRQMAAACGLRLSLSAHSHLLPHTSPSCRAARTGGACKKLMCMCARGFEPRDASGQRVGARRWGRRRRASSLLASTQVTRTRSCPPVDWLPMFNIGGLTACLRSRRALRALCHLKGPQYVKGHRPGSRLFPGCRRCETSRTCVMDQWSRVGASNARTRTSFEPALACARAMRPPAQCVAFARAPASPQWVGY